MLLKSIKQYLIKESSLYSRSLNNLDQVKVDAIKRLLRWGNLEDELDSETLDEFNIEANDETVKINSDSYRDFILSFKYDEWERLKLPKNIFLDFKGTFEINPGYKYGNNKNFNVLEGYTFESLRDKELTIKIFISDEGDSIIKNCSFKSEVGEVHYESRYIMDPNDPRQVIIYKMEGSGNLVSYKDSIEILQKRLYNSTNTFEFKKLDIGNISIGIDTNDLPDTQFLKNDYKNKIEELKKDNFIFNVKTQNFIKKSIRKDLNLPIGMVKKLDYTSHYRRSGMGIAWSDVTSK